MGTLRTHLEQYVSLRRAMGFQVRDVARQLDKFVSHLHAQGQTHITTEVTVAWIASLPISPGTKTSRFGMIRNFAQYLHALDQRHEVPPRRLFTARQQRKQPYIYSDEEIARLMHAAEQIPSAAGFCAATFTTLLGLLVVTGMRHGECLALNDADVDWNEGVLAIVGTKFRKSRLVPLHSSTRDQLRQYVQRRNRLWPRPRSPSLLVSSRGTRLWRGNVRNTFHSLSCRIGLRQPGKSRGPRLHDFRHSFAVRTLRNWYQTGVDVEQRLPELSTYLGHAHVSSTYWYLTGTPDLLQMVAARVDGSKERKLP